MADASSKTINLELRNRLKEMIISALKQKYVSTSSYMDYKTGNAYQTVAFDDMSVAGYRDDRSSLFGVFDFTDRSVLDCGCNIGQLSRLARARGAALVDGIEYDGYFVQIAQLINAYCGTRRVSFQQGDLTNEETVTQTYDVTLAFSVFPYVEKILPKIAEATRHALVLETHNITSDLQRIYIDPVRKFFPHYTFVDFTDLGHGEGKRAVLVFAKQLRTLLPGGFYSSTVDLARSQWHFPDAMLALTRDIAPGPRSLATLEVLAARADELPDDSARLTAGTTYWLKMTKGYLEYCRTGAVTLDNTYLSFLRHAMATQNFDPLLAERLSSDQALIDRVELRFMDIRRLAQSDRRFANITPIRILNIMGSGGRFAIVNGITASPIFATTLDGFHRVFWGLFFSIETLPALYLVS
jgi:SAM-dependent methyltransferase